MPGRLSNDAILARALALEAAARYLDHIGGSGDWCTPVRVREVLWLSGRLIQEAREMRLRLPVEMASYGASFAGGAGAQELGSRGGE